MIKDSESEIRCFCPACESLFLQSKQVLEESLANREKLEGGQAHSFEELEELRLFLKSFMKPAVLQAVVDVLGVLDEEPKHTEMFSYFVRNSQYGAECRYALTALKKFKEQKISKLKQKLEVALTALEDL